MKKVWTAISALAAMCLLAVPAQVLALTGPHNTATAGACANCHIPHSSGGDRLWVTTPSGPATNWGNNKIGQLCYSCHDGSFTGGGLTASNMGTYIYADNSAHGNDYTAIPYMPDGLSGTATAGLATMQGTGLPYTSATNPLLQGGNQRIQCTSCHFVHDDVSGSRPYLRTGAAGASRGDLCEDCHRRGEATGNGSKGANNSFAYAQNVSLHPVDISATVASEGATLVATAGALSWATTGDANGDWRLGGHLNAGNVECTTCHAVHGSEGAGIAALGNYKLSIENYPANYVTSPLCYGCHGLPVVVGGADHPIDSNSGYYTVNYPLDGGPAAGGAASPWPAGAGANAQVVCSSCHDAHGGLPANAADATQGNTLVGRLRRMGGNAADWCQSCHVNASPNNHHSHLGNLAIAQGDPMDSVLRCGDCHGGANGSVAHNNTGSFFATRNYGSGNHATNPRWCNYCHAINPTDLDQPVARAVADTITAPGFRNTHTAGGTAVTPAANGIDRGEATHILGYDGAFTAANTQPIAVAWPNADNTRFTGSVDGVADNVSRWQTATAGDMVCESCHNIIGNVGWNDGATGNEGWMVNLLLEDYYDDGAGNKAAANAGLTGAAICMGCHHGATIFTTKPTGTHQITGDSITAAVDNSRATTTLVTTAALGTYANAAAAPGDTSYPANNQMDCDSCHRPHDAAINGQTTATTGTYGAAFIKGLDYILEECGAAVAYSPTLCANCHNY